MFKDTGAVHYADTVRGANMSMGARTCLGSECARGGVRTRGDSVFKVTSNWNRVVVYVYIVT